MSTGYIYCYLGNDATPSVTAFEKLFMPIGLHLEVPRTPHVFALSSTGDQIATSREEISSRLAERCGVNLQWWFGACDDVYCGFHTDTINGQWRVTFRLDGVDPDKAASIIDRMLLYFKDNCQECDAAALVVDRTVALERCDWDAVVAGMQMIREVPDILILPRSL